jgi:tetratricopeptide (TPR) repeat protein
MSRRLGTEFIVEGSVERQGDRVRVIARLIQASSGTLRWTRTYERSLGDLFALEGEIATAIGSEIGARLTRDTKRRLLASQTSSVAAQDAYLQGRYLIYTFNRARFDEARRLLEHAVALDSSYAVAYASLSRTYGLMLDGDLAPAQDLVPLAVAAAARAVQLNPDLPEANVAFDESKYKYEHDWESADAAYQRALILAPNASTVRSPYARFLCAQGRLDEGLTQALAGGQADPLSAEMIATIAITHYYRREYDEALRYYEQAVDLTPGYGPAYFGMARVFSAQHEYAKAIEYVRKAISLVGENQTYLAELSRNDALAGWRDSAEQVLGGLIRTASDSSVGASYEGIGYTFAALGQNDRAFEWLNRSLDHYYARLLYLKVDPRADPLRDDARFTALIERLGLTR